MIFLVKTALAGLILLSNYYRILASYQPVLYHKRIGSQGQIALSFKQVYVTVSNFKAYKPLFMLHLQKLSKISHYLLDFPGILSFNNRRHGYGYR